MKRKKKRKKYNLKYLPSRRGDICKIEIRDQTYRILYKKKFNISDKQALVSALSAIEAFSGFSIQQVIRENLKLDWF